MKLKYKGEKAPVIISMLIFIMVLVAVGFFMQFRMRQLLYYYMEKQVTDQAGELSELVRLRFDMELRSMERVSDGINQAKNGEEGFITSLKEYLYLEESEKVVSGLLALDGSALCGIPLKFSEFTGIQDAFRGNSSISFCEEKGLLFTVPIYRDKNVKYVFYKLYANDILAEEFFVDCFEGRVDLTALDINDKEIVPFKEHSFQDLYVNEKMHSVYSELQDRLNVASTASMNYQDFSGGHFMFVTEVSSYGIYLVGIIPDEVMSQGLSALITLVIWVFALLILLLMIGITYLFNAEERAKESDELRVAKLVAENASKSKSDFLANMSHEIRTPINAIMGMNEMILRECDSADIKKYAMNIQSASHALLSLINDVLDLSKIESGKMEILPDTYQLDTMIHDVVNLVQVKAEQKKLNFHAEVEESLPNHLLGDVMRNRQIIVNLCNNAVKYTREGSVSLKVSAKTDSDRQDEGQVVLQISISDTGIGIKEEDMGKLFGNFERLDLKKNRNIEGTGLGLAITKKLTETMGGWIEVESEYGKGSVFTVFLPQKVVDSEPVGVFEQNTMKEADNENIYQESFIAPDVKILVVDDNELNLLVVESLLKKTQVQVTLCDGGEQCLSLIQKEFFHIILLDHMMPDIDGIEVMKRSKTLEGNLCKSSPMIALTANAIKGVREMYINEGFDDYLSKPIESSDLEQMIRKFAPPELIREP